MKVTCTSGTVVVYPGTGVTTPNGLYLPLVANPAGKKIDLAEGSAMEVENNGDPAVGGKTFKGSSTFSIANNGKDTVEMARWHEVDNDPIYIEDPQSYIDLDGNHTEDNYTLITLAAGESYETKVVTSNAQTVTVLSPRATIQPV